MGEMTGRGHAQRNGVRGPGRGARRGAGEMRPGGLPGPASESGRLLSELSDWVLVTQSSLTQALKPAEPEGRVEAVWAGPCPGPCPEGAVCRVCGWTPVTERTAAMSPQPPVSGDRVPLTGPRPPRVRGLALEDRSVWPGPAWAGITWAGWPVTPGALCPLPVPAVLGTRRAARPPCPFSCLLSWRCMF